MRQRSGTGHLYDLACRVRGMRSLGVFLALVGFRVGMGLPQFSCMRSCVGVKAGESLGGSTDRYRRGSVCLQLGCPKAITSFARGPLLSSNPSFRVFGSQIAPAIL